jgi:hypothetical protein
MIRWRECTARRAKKWLDTSRVHCMMRRTQDTTCFASRPVADKRTTRPTSSQLSGPDDSPDLRPLSKRPAFRLSLQSFTPAFFLSPGVS